MAAVTLRNLTIALAGSTIIEDLSLEVASGEFLVLLGPSGCGKSTLLNGIAGLCDIRDGDIAIDGKDVTGADPADRNIGMVFQSYALYPTMTVAENLSFGLRVRGVRRDEIAARVRRTAELLHLETLLARKPAELSGGQRQRVAIGRALVREARVFLLDEPLSNLDAGLRAELRRELKLLHRRLGATMIHVTHDQVEAMTLATRIAVMRDGRILQQGAPEEVYARPASQFVAKFLGSPATNLVPGVVCADGGNLAVDAAGCRLDLADYSLSGPRPAHGQSVVLGVRPEHIRIGERSRLAGRVSLVERMGNAQVVWIDWRGNVVSCLSHDAREFKPDELVHFDIDASRISVFDAASELRL
ncbi:MAG TPA: ABC transporter ATP-binding protein [Steroidobacteraceae bacterium]|nr:ABC transporter ATP-binding protein [Steroidobacteraceae bacterium]